MARKENQKLKLLYLDKIFHEDTDEEHGLTMQEIICRLAAEGISADRKTLYHDFQELSDFGEDIIRKKRGRSTYYFLGSRTFELAELKMLVDSVQAAKFITDVKSRELIRKLETLVSKHEAKQLNRQVVIAGRVKTSNRMIFYNVDNIYEAIDKDRQITFHYFQWNVEKEQILRHDGALYQVSPWSLMWDDEYYYLVAYDGASRQIRHYRVDKMLQLEMTDLPREGKKAFQKFDVAKYSKCLFGMYGGEETSVTLEGGEDLAAVLIDRFGKDIVLTPQKNHRFTARISVIPSDQFLGWIVALGKDIRITGPDEVVSRMRKITNRLSAQYTAAGEP